MRPIDTWRQCPCGIQLWVKLTHQNQPNQRLAKAAPFKGAGGGNCEVLTRPPHTYTKSETITQKEPQCEIISEAEKKKSPSPSSNVKLKLGTTTILWGGEQIDIINPNRIWTGPIIFPILENMRRPKRIQEKILELPFKCSNDKRRNTTFTSRHVDSSLGWPMLKLVPHFFNRIKIPDSAYWVPIAKKSTPHEVGMASTSRATRESRKKLSSWHFHQTIGSSSMLDRNTFQRSLRFPMFICLDISQGSNWSGLSHCDMYLANKPFNLLFLSCISKIELDLFPGSFGVGSCAFFT